MLRAWLIAVTEPAVVVIDAMAMLIIVFATLRAFVHILQFVFGHSDDSRLRRAIWLDYGRWLVAALTFQLAADVIESSVVPTWQAIGQLGAVALIRTFLNYFLERDISEIRERQREPAGGESAGGESARP